MTERDNYDSLGIDTGLSVGEIFSQFEMRMIANRKAVLEKAIKSGDFKTSVYTQLDEYMQASKRAAELTLSQALEITGKDIRKAYEIGTSTVDKAMSAYKKQGYKPPKEPSIDTANMFSLVAAVSSILGIYKSISAYSQDKAKTQLLSIAAQVNGDADDLASEVDRVQSLYLKKGIAGAEDKAGNEKSMSAQAEYTLRNESHAALLKAEGERHSEYGHHLVIVSAHPSSCPLCVDWQSQILVDDVYAGGVPDGKHELLSTAFAAGLGHYNCRHNWIPYVEGLDKPDIFKRDTASPEETALRYAVEQEQRYNERMIREWKRREEGSLSEAARRQAEYKVKEWQAQQRHLGKIAKEKGVPFYRQYDREQIGGDTKPTIKSEVKELYNYLTERPKSVNVNRRVEITQEELDNSIKKLNESGVTLRTTPRYNSSLRDYGKATISIKPTGQAVVKKIEIGKQKNASEKELLDTLIHEELETRLVLQAYNGDTGVDKSEKLEQILQSNISKMNNDKLKHMLKDNSKYSKIHSVIDNIIREFFNGM